MKPYFERGGIVIYHGDCRELLPRVKADTLITDPVWPNGSRAFPGVDPYQLIAKALAVANVERVVLQLGCASDPRILRAVPLRWPFIRTCSLEHACPSPQGRIFNTGDVAYAFGAPPRPEKGRMVIPGKCVAALVDDGYARSNWDTAANGKRPGSRSAPRPHPAPRRLTHVAWLVKWFTDDIVVDAFMGTGPVLRAAMDQGKRAIGIEIEERYCELAARRLEQDVLFHEGEEGEGH